MMLLLTQPPNFLHTKVFVNAVILCGARQSNTVSIIKEKNGTVSIEYNLDTMLS